MNDQQIFAMWTTYWDLVNKTGTDFLGDLGVNHDSVERDVKTLGMAIDGLKKMLQSV